ncbi:hypothetical protein EDC44_10535 [Cricetibacter osteomyelitidis]|uniref:Uncharacterized protein n=1 Tax=Cricetibacter osteomyelitidis TaxID=1521931 RepID=A0A4R2T2N2_9PAST|nr:hypothetical protein [Cricetibacter osteomyelitidis]TCP96215.1 hypothetical protein EDC44_10535 [Cricetibacter osteomyelitidis]
MELQGKMYPYPFIYSADEQRILSFFYQREKLLFAVTRINYANDYRNTKNQLYFEIVATPTENNPYYLVRTYTDGKEKSPDGELKFSITSDGKQVYREGYAQLIPFDDWLNDSIRQAIEYQKEHPDMPNKFNPANFGLNVP